MADIFGTLDPSKLYLGEEGKYTASTTGLIDFLNNLLTLVITLAGIFTLVNFILAGYQYLSSSGDPQKIAQAGNKLLQSFVGLAIVAGGFIIAALLGYLLFNDPKFLLQPTFPRLFLSPSIYPRSTTGTL